MYLLFSWHLVFILYCVFILILVKILYRVFILILVRRIRRSPVEARGAVEHLEERRLPGPHLAEPPDRGKERRC